MNTLQVFGIGKVQTQFAIVQSAYVGEFFIYVDEGENGTDSFVFSALEEIKASIRSRRIAEALNKGTAADPRVHRYTAEEVAEFLSRSIYYK